MQKCRNLNVVVSSIRKCDVIAVSSFGGTFSSFIMCGNLQHLRALLALILVKVQQFRCLCVLAFLVGGQRQFRSIGSHIFDMCRFGMHQHFLGVFGSGKAAPHEHVDFASVKPSFGMPCVDASSLCGHDKARRLEQAQNSRLSYPPRAAWSFGTFGIHTLTRVRCGKNRGSSSLTKLV